MSDDKLLYCSFCGRRQDIADKLESFYRAAFAAGQAESGNVVENLAGLVNRLCRQVNLVLPGNDVAVKAAEYMHRNNLLGTALRSDDEGVTMLVDMIRSAGNTEGEHE